jgi:hypothetical protein
VNLIGRVPESLEIHNDAWMLDWMTLSQTSSLPTGPQRRGSMQVIHNPRPAASVLAKLSVDVQHNDSGDERPGGNERNSLDDTSMPFGVI